MLARLRRLDPRFFQLAFQAALLATGVFLRDFSLLPSQMALAISAAVAPQGCWLKVFKLQRIGYLSPTITGFGLSLLLRADNLWLHPLVAALAISSKFLLRINGKHVFNPANFGVGIALLFLPGAWVSPGQWGSDIAIAVWVVALGALVAHRSRRDDAAWIFLATYLGLAALRVVILGYTWQRGWDVLCHQATNGALLLFAFFMISDPMTLPDHPRARAAHVMLVALVAAAWQFLYFHPNGPLWALLAGALLVHLWDRRWPAKAYRWRPFSAATQQIVTSPP